MEAKWNCHGNKAKLVGRGVIHGHGSLLGSVEVDSNLNASMTNTRSETIRGSHYFLHERFLRSSGLFDSSSMARKGASVSMKNRFSSMEDSNLVHPLACGMGGVGYSWNVNHVELKLEWK